MNFIKDIFDGKIDNSVHLQFQKFSKGEFGDRALIKAKRSGKKYTISTTAEFANELVRKAAEKLGSDKTRVTGAIVSTSDMKGELDFKEIKQFQGVKRYIIDREMSGDEIISMLDKFPKAFFALSFSCDKDSTNLKIKPKAPKSGKPGKKDSEKFKPDFCKLTTTDSEWGKSFVFENPDFKTAEITHKFLIDEIIKPEGEEDYARIRELAKRKGRVIRKAEIDDKKSVKEFDFEA
jgi:hypothetical protein